VFRVHQFPLCPFSRYARLALAEKGHAPELAEARPWEKDEAFLVINPAGQTPALEVEEGALADSAAIAEWAEERWPDPPLLPAGPFARAEARRMVAWFNQKFYAEVGVHLLEQRLLRRLVRREPPDSGALRRAARAAEEHLDYLEWLIDSRGWVAGDRLTLADLAAAAHLSVADYLSGIDWQGHETARTWYSAIKSRPAMRAVLAERVAGLPPPAHYAVLDF
jgi:glutathione S-transferase